MSFKKLLSLWLPVILWAGLIFLLSSQPTKVVSGFIWWDFIIKKTAHIIEYGILYFLLFRAINNLEFRIKNLEFRIAEKNKKINWLIPFIILLFYAATDEFHQSFIPGRTAKLRDVGIDLLGGLISYWQTKSRIILAISN